MILLAIDPGITTGVALLDHDGSIIESYEVKGDEAYAIVALIADETYHDVVIEQGPASRDNRFMDELDGWLRAVFPDAHWLLPGEWKGTPRAMQKVDGVLSHHAKDAVRMGREYLYILSTAPTKRCSKCKEDKPLTDFTSDKYVSNGKRSWCKACDSVYERMARCRRYGLTLEEYDELLQSQGNACAICKGDIPKLPQIDHDHDTGKVRGVLCITCNTGLGAFRDDPDLLLAAREYLLFQRTLTA
jgi:hypothetical protein